MSISNKEMKYLLSKTAEEAERQMSPKKMDEIKDFHKYKKMIEEHYHKLIEVEDSDQTVTWEDLREATWGDTSITQDMRRMNTQRLLNEVRARIETIAAEHTTYNGTLNATAHQLRDQTMSMLRRYHEMGALQNFRVNSIQQTEELGSRGPEVNMSVTIVPTASLERINMSVRLTP